MDDLTQKALAFLPWYAIFLFSTVCHEAAHAWCSGKLGDNTAHEFVSLNPLPHIRRSLFGMVLLPLFFFVMKGWIFGYASVPLNTKWALNYPRRYGLVSLAGPLTNFLLMILGLTGWVLVSKYGGELGNIAESAERVFSIMFQLNLILGVFNMLPLPPLDGCHVPLVFIPRGSLRQYMDIVWNPSMALPGLLLAYIMFPQVLARLSPYITALLYFLLD